MTTIFQQPQSLCIESANAESHFSNTFAVDTALDIVEILSADWLIQVTSYLFFTKKSTYLPQNHSNIKLKTD